MFDAFITDALPIVIFYVAKTAPIWVPFILVILFWEVWVVYVRAQFFLKQEVKLLQIKLPKDLMKSPLAMELFLTSLHQTGGEGTWYDKYWLGKTRPWFSLEMASIEGKVGFYIWTRKSMQKFIESSLYAQFPGIEIHEVPDYSLPITFDPKTMKMWAANLQFTKPDAYPIKTYVDYGLDKDPKEEFKVDPLAPVLEFLGSIGANQQAWFQIIIRAHKGDQKKPGTLFKMNYDPYKEEAKEIINELMQRDPKTKVVPEGEGGKIVITKGEAEIIAAIERNLTKLQFEVGIRIIYFGKKEFYDPANISGMTGSWKQYASESLNGFKPNSKFYSPRFSYPWQDFQNRRSNGDMEEALEAYKRRSFFYGPIMGEPIHMSSEELATIYHFPGQVASTPSFTRILSKKSEAPANLPL